MKREIDLPPLKKESPIPQWIHCTSTDYKPSAISTKLGSLPVRSAHGKEVWKIEEMILTAASMGDGYGVDEFTEDGYFNRAFLNDSHTFVVDSGQDDDTLVGGALFGSSSLARTIPSPLAQCYIIVHPDYRGQGIGKALIRYFMNLAKSLQFEIFITDVLGSDPIMPCIVKKLGMSGSGAMKYSAYKKGEGFVDSSIFFKSLKDQHQYVSMRGWDHCVVQKIHAES